MLTEVTFAKKDEEIIIAYANAKKQHVFLSIVRADLTPKLANVLITSQDYTIQDVLHNYFEFEIYKQENIDIGIKEKHIWKPLLVGDLGKELDFSVYELCKAKRDLSILIQRLQEILLYVEPSKKCLQTYSHKLMELLILACTEFECWFKNYNYGKNERTSDYVNILKIVDLQKYKVELAGYSETFQSKPFANWNPNKPTQSLPWYDAYTKVKHNITNAFDLATLENCINAICANIVMFCIRYSPYPLYQEADVCSGLVRNTFDLQLEHTEDICIPVFEGTKSYSGAFSASQSFKNGKTISDIYDVHTLIPFELK